MFELTAVDDVAIVHLTGELSHHEMLEIEGVLRKLMDSSKVKVVLNFENVEHVNYKTITRLLDRAWKLRALSGDLKCASMSNYTRDIFRFTGADQVVEAYESVYDAVMSFNGVQEKYRTWH
jgi:anti-anti-sigma factor